ncbi:MAG: acetylxylan esterase [bacterium]
MKSTSALLATLLVSQLGIAMSHAAGTQVQPNTFIKVTTDRTNAIYKVGEKVVFHVTLATNAQSSVSELSWILTLDGASVLGQGTLSLTSGTTIVEGTLDQPGVLQLKVTPKDNADKLGTGMAGAAFDPYTIKPTAKLPADFEAFWNDQKSALPKIPLDPKITPVSQGDPDVELYEVSFANIAAALDPRITAVVSIAPALGEHTGPLYGRPDAAPNNLIMGRDKKTPDPKIVASTAYYDTVNFARFVKVPVLMSSGLIDTACPAMTVLSIYNTLNCPKQLDLVPLLGHNRGPRFDDMKNHFMVEQVGILDHSGRTTTSVNMGAPIFKK